MKNLVLGALLAVASVSAGCTASTSTGDDGGGGGGGGGGGTTVHVTWDFTHLADGSARSCPTGFGTATVKSQLIDDSSHLGIGKDFTDLFNCADGAGTILLPTADQYLVWVEISNDSGSDVYAQSESHFVDTNLAVSPISVEILDDGGYFFFTWDLVDANNNHVSCANAGVTSSGSVEAISTSVATPSYFKDDKFTCEDHYGTTDGLPADTYTVSIDAEQNNNPVGTAPTLTNKTITAPNGLTDLGDILIPLD